MRFEDILAVSQVAEVLRERSLECRGKRLSTDTATVNRYIREGMSLGGDRPLVKLPAYLHPVFGYMVHRSDLEDWMENVWSKSKVTGGRPRKAIVAKQESSNPYFGRGRKKYRAARTSS